MEIVPPSEDSNSQDSGEFAPDNRHIFNQNNHNFGGPPDNFAMGPVNQFDYQVKHICCFNIVDAQSPFRGCVPLISSSDDFHSSILQTSTEFVIC